jgi:hypothetical protein
MTPLYIRIRERARQVAANHPPPDFYRDHATACLKSKEIFQSNPIIVQLTSFVEKHMEDDFGHGPAHAAKVAIDAGALLMIEHDLADFPKDEKTRRVIVAQSAGLLHDIKRKRKNHAMEGSLYCRTLLARYPFEPNEIDDICQSIRNHEAFKHHTHLESLEGTLVSDCLYDADKFRWGPDNFTDTVWAMVSYLNPPLSAFVDRYPKGMKGLAAIKDTFRTKTGRKYGPQFIDIGLSIGEELLEIINQEFLNPS